MVRHLLQSFEPVFSNFDLKLCLQLQLKRKKLEWFVIHKEHSVVQVVFQFQPLGALILTGRHGRRGLSENRNLLRSLNKIRSLNQIKSLTVVLRVTSCLNGQYKTRTLADLAFDTYPASHSLNYRLAYAKAKPSAEWIAAPIFLQSSEIHKQLI